MFNTELKWSNKYINEAKPDINQVKQRNAKAEDHVKPIKLRKTSTDDSARAITDGTSKPNTVV